MNKKLQDYLSKFTMDMNTFIQLDTYIEISSRQIYS
jgi:hypothetical protein